MKTGIKEMPNITWDKNATAFQMYYFHSSAPFPDLDVRNTTRQIGCKNWSRWNYSSSLNWGCSLNWHNSERHIPQWQIGASWTMNYIINATLHYQQQITPSTVLSKIRAASFCQQYNASSTQHYIINAALLDERYITLSMLLYIINDALTMAEDAFYLQYCFTLATTNYIIDATYTSQKMKFSIKDFLSKCDQIRRKLKKSLMENFIFCAVLHHQRCNTSSVLLFTPNDVLYS